VPNPFFAFLRGDHLPKRADVSKSPPQAQQRVVDRKLYFYPDNIAPTTAIDQDIYQAIRMGTLVHGPGASDLIYRAWHHEDQNSAVYACLKFICTASIEAPLTVFRQTDVDDRDPVLNHPMQDFLNSPNPHLSMKVLEYYKTWCKLVNGNAYQRKVRAGAGVPVQLWPISPLRIVPVTTKEDAARGIFISYYAYKFDPAKDPERIPPQDIIHFRQGLNDKDHRLGDSPLARVSREVMGDEGAMEWQNQLLNNGGAASMIVEVPVDSTLTQDGAEDLKARMEDRFAGKNRFSVGVLMGGAKVNPYGFSPVDMDTKSLHRFPEERISAVFGSPAVIVGLGAGLDRSIYNNYHEARQAFTTDTLLPNYEFDADVLNSRFGLKYEFTSDKNVIVAYDISKMRALQEDQTNKYKRVTEAWDKNLLTLNQALAELGFPTEPGGDVRKAEMMPAPVMGETGNGSSPRTQISELPAGSKQRPLLAVGDLSSFPEILQALVELAEPAMQEDIERHLDRQRKTIKRRLVAGG
jgi:HK97 family phage portal protein